METKIFHQQRIRFAFATVSVLSILFDVLGALALFFTIFGIAVIFTFLMAPLFFDVFTILGAGKGFFPREFFVDANELIPGTLLRMAILAPALIAVLIREKITVPIRSKAAAIAAGIMGMPAFLIVSELLFSALLSDTGGAFPVTKLLFLSFFSWIGGDIGDQNSMNYAFLIFLYFGFLFPSFLYIPYLAINFFGRHTIGYLSANVGSSSAWPWFFGFSKGVVAKMLSLRSLMAFARIFLAFVIGATVIQVDRFSLPSPIGKQVYFILEGLSSPEAENWSLFLGLSFASVTAAIVGTLACGLSITLSDLKKKLFKVLQCACVASILMVLAIVSAKTGDESSFIKWYYGQVAFGAAFPIIVLIATGLGELRYQTKLASIETTKSSTEAEETILLLRSFALDEIMVKRQLPFAGALNIMDLLKIRLEEVVAHEAFLFAPVVAVANPHEQRPNLGAIREFLSDAEWQPFVEEKISESKRILFILGKGNFTGWETDKILDSEALDKTIFIVPPQREHALEYLAQNQEIVRAFGGEKFIETIQTTNIICFLLHDGIPHLVRGMSNSELDYSLALRRALTL